MGCNCGGGRSSSAREPQGAPGGTYRLTHPNGAKVWYADKDQAEGDYTAAELKRLERERGGFPPKRPAELRLLNPRTNQPVGDYTPPKVTLPPE